MNWLLRITLLAPCLLACAITYGQDKAAQKLLEKTNRATAKTRSAFYRIEFRDWQSVEEDTLILKADVYLQKAPQDQLYGYKMSLHIPADSVVLFYDLTSQFVIDHKHKEVYEFGKEHRSLVQGNVYRHLIAGQLFQGLTDENFRATNLRLRTDLESSTHRVLELRKPDTREVTNWVMQVWVHKKTHLPEITYKTYSYEGVSSHTQISLSEVKVNHPAVPAYLSGNVLPNAYRFVKREKEPEVRPDLLSAGSAAPDFSLTDLDGNSLKLSDFAGKYLLLDFWYASCGPCLKAMPHLQRLHDKLAASGLVVIGLNPHDTNTGKIKTFLKDRNITYTSALHARPVTDQYRVSAYPTLYLIGPDGRILFSAEGLDPETLEQQIANLIR